MPFIFISVYFVWISTKAKVEPSLSSSLIASFLTALSLYLYSCMHKILNDTEFFLKKSVYFPTKKSVISPT